MRSTADRAQPNIGPYRILGVLGSGGTAIVYLAEHILLGKRVALKQLLPRWTGNADVRSRFLQEARIACALDHKSLAKVHDFGSHDGAVYFVMDVVHGDTVAERLDRGDLARSQALEIGAGIADAVSAVHAAGVLHLDIKTENVMLGRRGDREVPILIDFGVASVARSSRCWTLDAVDSLPIGTPRCMAPEQAGGDALDERTDVWGLGVLLYEMLENGVAPFGDGSVRETLIEVVTADPHPMSEAVPTALRALVQRCLDKEPTRRPASAALVRDGVVRAAWEYRAQTAAVEDDLLQQELDEVLSELEATSVH